MSIVLNSIFPVFALIILGSVLKWFHFINDDFLKTSDRLIYFIFFPALLFWKIGAPSSPTPVDWKLSLAVLSAVFAIYAAGLVFIKINRIADFKVGSFSQCTYRFNTYVGMAIILIALGDESVREFAVMIGVAIPFINLLAVSTLIWHSGNSYHTFKKAGLVLKAILSNPLILACFAGIFYSKVGLPFPRFADNTFRLSSLVTLPLALISIGGSLNIAKLKGQLKMSMVANLFKLLLLPAAGYFFLRAYGVTPIPFKVGMIYFALPTSTAAYILSSQLQSDVDLAAATIFLSTLLSAISLSVVMIVFVA
jgi:predicted permease